MDARHAELLHSLDLSVLGARIRAARHAAGLTQGQLADGQVTISYVSRIESGNRRPDGRLLEQLAARLGVTLDDLLLGPDHVDEAATRLEVDFAELALESGDARAADQHLTRAVARLGDSDSSLRRRATFLRARALEAVGDLDAAIDIWEQLVAGSDSEWKVASGIALCRCYREAGDLGRAIAVGEQLLDSLHRRQLGGSDEAVRLTVTVAAAYFQMGDTHHAVRLCRGAIQAAEASGSPQARASAYWNASMMEAEQGGVASAVELAQRALALLGEGEDVRNLARLRSQLGIMQMQLDPPAVEEAVDNLHVAAAAMSSTSASHIDIVRNQVALARAEYLRGNASYARRAAHQGYLDSVDVAPLLAADARALEGQAAAAEGDTTAARSLFKEAAHILTAVGADREAAQLWLELGSLLESVGEDGAARDAYRSAAAASGLHVRATVTARVPT